MYISRSDRRRKDEYRIEDRQVFLARAFRTENGAHRRTIHDWRAQ